MKPFFLYICTGLLTLYALFFGPELGISGPSSFSNSIVIAFTVSFLAAANLSLFRKKAAAVIGIVAFFPALLLVIYLTVQTIAALGFIQWEVFFVLALSVLIGYANFYSLKYLLFNKELQWNTKSQVIYILRFILIGIQICIGIVIYNQG